MFIMSNNIFSQTIMNNSSNFLHLFFSFLFIINVINLKVYPMDSRLFHSITIFLCLAFSDDTVRTGSSRYFHKLYNFETYGLSGALLVNRTLHFGREINHGHFHGNSATSFQISWL